MPILLTRDLPQRIESRPARVQFDSRLLYSRSLGSAGAADRVLRCIHGPSTAPETPGGMAKSAEGGRRHARLANATGFWPISRRRLPEPPGAMAKRSAAMLDSPTLQGFRRFRADASLARLSPLRSDDLVSQPLQREKVKFPNEPNTSRSPALRPAPRGSGRARAHSLRVIQAFPASVRLAHSRRAGIQVEDEG